MSLSLLQGRSWCNGYPEVVQAGKGFGFISVDRGGADVFVHQTAIRCDDFRELRENQRVEFDVMQGQKGLQAADSDATG